MDGALNMGSLAVSHLSPYLGVGCFFFMYVIPFLGFLPPLAHWLGLKPVCVHQKGPGPSATDNSRHYLTNTSFVDSKGEGLQGH